MGEERGMQSRVEEEERGKTVKGRRGQQQKGHHIYVNHIYEASSQQHLD